MLNLAFIVAVILLILSFYGVCFICDEHLVPCVEVFIKTYNVPEEMAAVTLVAFGSAAPELILNMVSAIENTSDISTPAVLGSAMIAFGLIPPLCVLCTQKDVIQLKVWPIIRETFFYLFGLGIFLSAIYDGEMYLYEALIVTFVYILYVGTVSIIYFIGKNNNDNKTILVVDVDTDADTDESSALLDLIERNKNEAVIIPTNNLYYAWVINIFNVYLANPFQNTLAYLMPKLRPNNDSKGKVSLSRAFSVLGMCIVYIAIFTSIIVNTSSILVSQLNVDNSTIGATLVALGSEIPDTISAVALAKNGYYDGAMAGAIGSQVINISLGVGLPALLLCMSSTTGSYKINSEQTNSLWLLTSLLYAVVFTYVGVTLPIINFISSACISVKDTYFTKSGAIFLLCVWMSSYVIFVYSNEA